MNLTFHQKNKTPQEILFYFYLAFMLIEWNGWEARILLMFLNIIFFAFQIENIEHCDFLSLRNLLIRSHLQDLKSKTSQELYEIYRSQTLSVMSCNESNTVS